MLYDRDYMRGEGSTFWRSPINLLLVVLIGLFFVECILRVYGGGQSLATYFGLNYPTLTRLQVWRLVTYQFLHDAPWPLHILFNSIGLWFFGRAVLESLGTSRFWQVYFAAGILGGLLEVGFQALNPVYGRALVVGASASVMGLAGAFCLMHPAQDVTFFLYVIPIRVRSMMLFWILLGFSIFGIVFLPGSVAHAAHLGGLLTGAAYVRFFLQEEAGEWLRRWRPGRLRARKADPVAVPVGSGAGRDAGIPGGSVEKGESPEDFMRREVDPILDKISAHGIQSLTEKERRILEKARERMRNR